MPNRRPARQGAGVWAAIIAPVWLCGCAHQASMPDVADSDALSWIVGKWDGARVETSTGDRAPLTTEVKSVLGGAGEEEQLTIRTSKGTYRGLYLQVSDPKLKKSVMMYVNSTRRTFARLEGVIGTDRAEWESTTSQAPHRSKLVYERIDGNSWRRTQWVSEDDGRTWTILFVDELHRRGGTI